MDMNKARELTVAADKVINDMVTRLPSGTVREFSVTVHSDICAMRMEVRVHCMDIHNDGKHQSSVEYVVNGRRQIHPENATSPSDYYTSLNMKDGDCVVFLKSYGQIKAKLNRLIQESDDLDLDGFKL